MTILITGASGLIGARLLPRLVAAGLDCRALLRPGKTVLEGVDRIEGDLLDSETLVGAMKDVTAIIYLAAVFRTPDTDLIWKSNVDGTRNLIEAAKAHAPEARFILASTSNIYGESGTHPGQEGDVVDPEHPYPASKLKAETLLRECGLTWSILRFSFVYGDGDGHLEALPRQLAQVGWHPAKRMSLVHHRDIATAVQLALAGDLDGEIVNIADDAPTSMYELVEIAGELMTPGAEPLTDPWHLHVDNTNARRLGFEPSVRTVYQAVHDKLM